VVTVGIAEGVIFIRYFLQAPGSRLPCRSNYLRYLQYSSASFQHFTWGWYVHVSAGTATLNRVRCFWRNGYFKSCSKLLREWLL